MTRKKLVPILWVPLPIAVTLFYVSVGLGYPPVAMWGKVLGLVAALSVLLACITTPLAIAVWVFPKKEAQEVFKPLTPRLEGEAETRVGESD